MVFFYLRPGNPSRQTPGFGGGDAREYPGGILRLHPAFAYAEPRAEKRVAGLERARKSHKVGEGHGCFTEVNTLTFSTLTSGKSLVFLCLWVGILLSSSCSKISMKIYELWNISCFMWEEVCESQKEEYIWRRRICRNPGKDSLNFHRLWFWGLPRVGPV